MSRPALTGRIRGTPRKGVRPVEPPAATTRREALCGSGCSLARKGTSRLGGEQERGGDAHGAVEEGSDLEEF